MDFLARLLQGWSWLCLVAAARRRPRIAYPPGALAGTKDVSRSGQRPARRLCPVISVPGERRVRVAVRGHGGGARTARTARTDGQRQQCRPGRAMHSAPPMQCGESPPPGSVHPTLQDSATKPRICDVFPYGVTPFSRNRGESPPDPGPDHARTVQRGRTAVGSN